MASRRKKQSFTVISGSTDPRSRLNGEELLSAAKPVLKELAADLLVRADSSLPVTEALMARHAAEQKAERTADTYSEWRRSFVEQVAAAWLLSCVFVRTLEDRGLLGKNRIAGPGAEDSWKAFLQLAPSLSEREYLLVTFRELARLPAAADLFDVRHNPVWLLAPSAEGARKLLDLFRAPAADAPAFRFGGEDTRFLGDLYQDLSEDVRKRYALLQTPRFVESFILDRTLEPAIERFGLNDTNLIDPTCGSGHFLLGAFDRLFEHRLRAEPGLTPREAASKALDAVAGCDINPYAIAVARFRLTLAFIEKCGLSKLKDVPRLPLHLAVADSLLYNPQTGQQLGLVAGTDASKWEGSHFSLEDPQAARDVLFKQYAAVVGNPPYITPKDATLRRRYAELYSSCRMNYALTIPFAERFFQLARANAHVGMITANSFMKREFGKFLIESYLPGINLDLVVNTSGAYIPGHGTPTVLLFGTHERPTSGDVLTVLANRGEPTTPEDAETGAVWSSIARHWREVGFENEYISVTRVSRDTLSRHPWSLGGGGAAELKNILEERAERRLSEVVDDVGFSIIIGEDELFIRPAGTSRWGGIPGIPLVIGENVRDWSLSTPEQILCPFDEQTLDVVADPALLKELWPWKRVLECRVVSGSTSMTESGRQWFDVRRLSRDKHKTPLSITFAFVATHNHFVLDRGGKVFNRSAPIIKLPESATEDDHLAVLAYLNSSTAAFFFRQVLHSKGAQGVNEGHKSEEWEQFLEYSGTQIATVPLPTGWHSLAELGRVMVRLVEELRQNMPQAAIAQWAQSRGALCSDFGTLPRDLHQRLVAIQEELDWRVYSLFGLLDEQEARASEALVRDLFGDFAKIDCRANSPFPGELAAGHRAFELLLNRAETQWFTRNGYACTGDPDSYAAPTAALLQARMQAIRSNQNLRVLEQPQYKHRWTLPDATGEASRGVTDWALAALEKTLSNVAVVSGSRAAIDWLRLDPVRSAEALTLYLGGDAIAWCKQAFAKDAVPFLAALRHTEGGLEKRAVWETVWEAQRREDRGEPGGNVSPPPKYDQKDFRDANYFTLRGKLDVPKERFISYPGCESDQDKEPVYGWAGWDHLQRAVALAGLYQDRKQREGWSKDRLLPMLAGLLELLPWLKQWHHEPSADLGGERPCDQFEGFLNAECAEHGFTHDQLRSWRTAVKTRGSAGKTKKPKVAPTVEESVSDS